MNFPYTHVAGDTLDFAVSVPDYLPSAGWTLKYQLIPRFATPTQAPITITASANADGTYQVQQSPAQTAGWKPGAYGWARWVEKSGARQTLVSSNDQGETEVLQDPATAAQGYDSRSHARKVLEAIEACLENRATTTQREMVAYAIGNRSQAFDPNDSRAELVKLRNTYAWEVSDQEGLAAGVNRRRINTRIQRA